MKVTTVKDLGPYGYHGLLTNDSTIMEQLLKIKPTWEEIKGY